MIPYTTSCLPFNKLSLEQLYEIMTIRQEVFVVEQECIYLDNDNKDQDSFHLLIINEDQKIIAYARILPKGKSYQDYVSIGRVLTVKQARGNGFAKVLMEKAIEFCKKQFPKDNIKISAQSYLEAFYGNLNFKKVGEEYLEDGIPHMAMILVHE